MDRPKTTPRDFFLWAGAMLSLYGSVIAFITLLFTYINYAFANPQTYLPPNAYQGGVAYWMSAFIVLGIVCLVLMWFIHRSIKTDSTRADIWVRRWALYLTLFLAGATGVVDLIVLLDSFLSGQELTTPFLLKVVIVLGVAAIGFMHFLADLWGYWVEFPTRSRSVTVGVVLLGLLTIATGSVIIGTPWQAQGYTLDAQKVSDLQTIQSEILAYWERTGKLPSNLYLLNDAISNTVVPQDPQSGQPYGYVVMGATTFQLCANFNEDSRGIPALSSPSAPSPWGTAYAPTDDNWQHGSGAACFIRTINPALYPPQRGE